MTAPKPNPVAIAAWTAYGKVAERPRIDIGWPHYIKSGAPAIYIGSMKVSNG